MNFLQGALRKSNSLKIVGVNRGTTLWRGCHVQAVPPRKKVGFTEMVTYGVVIWACLYAYPFWVIYHIKEFQEKKD